MEMQAQLTLAKIKRQLAAKGAESLKGRNRKDVMPPPNLNGLDAGNALPKFTMEHVEKSRLILAKIMELFKCPIW